MKFPDFENMNEIERRDFLKLASTLLAVPFAPKALKFAVEEVLLGKAYAATQATPPKIYIEICLRDQWDFGSLFAAPWLGQNYSQHQGRTAFFGQPTPHENNFWLIPGAEMLKPHLNDIAVMELGECNLSGSESTHGHEAGGNLRSPGRVTASGNRAGKLPMDNVDKRPQDRGNVNTYSSTPTPLILHNFASRQANPNLRNGILLRSQSLEGQHTFYHFAGHLLNAQVDRQFDRETLLKTFAESASAPAVPTTLQKHTNLITKLIKRIDQRYLKEFVVTQAEVQQHETYLGTVGESTRMPAAATPFNLKLTSEESSFWTNDIPPQVFCNTDLVASCRTFVGRYTIGEMWAYAFKLIAGGKVRSMGLDYDFYDIHGPRNQFVLSSQAKQFGHPLARMIASLKAQGLWDQTLIAAFTVDGSRSPYIESYGDGTKNAVVLAGGGIKGGYYGDVRMINNSLKYHRPDDNGVPVSNGSTGRDGRVPAQDIYKTVAHAMGVSPEIYNGFADVKNGKVLQYMLKS